MVYKYIFADGTESEVDVDEETYRVLRKLDRKIKYNNDKNRTVALKHRTIEDIPDNCPLSEIGLNEVVDVTDLIEKKEQEEKELLELELEKSKLEDKKQQLQKILTEKQALAYFHSKYEKKKNVHIAKLLGITEGAVRKLILKAEMNLQKFGV